MDFYFNLAPTLSIAFLVVGLGMTIGSVTVYFENNGGIPFAIAGVAFGTFGLTFAMIAILGVLTELAARF